MITPKTPQQLAQAIEVLVGAYVSEAQRVAEAALNEAFARVIRSSSSSRRSAQRVVQPRPSAGRRRTAEELSDLREKLYGAVCAKPGEGMTVYARDTGLTVPVLQRPMTKLRAEGRVRCVGDRNLARYFPALGRKPKNSDA